MIYFLLSLFNKTCHFSGVKALWCSGRSVRLYFESTGFDFFVQFMIFCFLCFYFVLLFFQPFRKGKAKLNKYL